MSQNNISLAAYTVRVRKNGSPGEFLQLLKYSPHKNIVDELRNFLNQNILQYQRDEAAKTLLKVQQSTPNGNLTWGNLQAGNYGYEAELIDARHNTMSYKRHENDAEMLPYYYLFDFQEKANYGIALFQRFGVHGFKEIFVRQFEEFFKQNNPEYRIEFQQLIPEGLVNRYLEKGKISTITFIKHNPVGTLEDLLEGNNTRQFHAELSVKANRGYHLGSKIKEKINTALKKEAQLQGIFELGDFDFDAVKVKVKVGKESRTISLDGESEMRAYFDISDEVKVKNGHPELESIDKAAKKLLAELWNSLTGASPKQP